MFDSNRTWKEFQFKDFFKAVRGKRIVKDVDFFDIKNDDYKYPVITAKTSDNGIDGYYCEYNCPENSLIACGEANGMYCTYQKDKCWIMDTARIITFKNGKKFSMQLALFISTILKQNMYKFSYGRKAKPSNIDCLNIVLPVDSLGNPDWEYMENYISNIENRERESKGSIKDSITTCNKNTLTTLDKSFWKTFRIRELFDVDTGGDILPMEEQDGDIPVICLGWEDNGVCMTIDKNDKHPLYNKGTMTVAGWAGGLKAFYQPNDYYVKGRIKVCVPKFNMSIYSCLFICTVINYNSYLFSYGRKASGNKFLNIEIKLPANEEGKLDTEYMENYIKSLSYGDRI